MSPVDAAGWIGTATLIPCLVAATYAIRDVQRHQRRLEDDLEQLQPTPTINPVPADWTILGGAPDA